MFRSAKFKISNKCRLWSKGKQFISQFTGQSVAQGDSTPKKQDQKSTRCNISKPDIAKPHTAKPITAKPDAA